MDTGLHYVSLEKELAKCPDFNSPEEVHMMIDLLVTKDALWQSGTMLIQNTLSCLQVEKLLLNDLIPGQEGLYFENLVKTFESDSLTLSDFWPKVLEAYIIGLAKSTGMAISKLRTGVICAEEDVSLHDFGGNFLFTVESKQVIQVLEAASKWVRTQKKLQAASEKTETAELLGSVLDRLEFRRELIYVIGEKRQPKKSHTDLCLQLIKKILNSKSTLEVSQFENCFTQGIQSRVSNNNPIRALQKMDIDAAYGVYTSIINSIEEYRVVSNIKQSTDLLSFFVTFASKDTLPLARVFQQSILQFVDSNILGQKVLNWGLSEIKEVCGPSVMPLLQSSKPHGVDNSNVLSQLAMCYEDLLRSHMFNRARQRQQLSHCIVSWDTMQVATEEFEDSVNEKLMLKGEEIESVSVEDDRGGVVPVPALPISSWVHLRKVQMMIWVTLIGFELDIYRMWEFGFMYGYCKYLTYNQSVHIERSLNYVNEAIRKLTLKKQRSKNKAADNLIKEFTACARYLINIKTENDMLMQLAIANNHLCEAAVMAGFPSPPASISAHTDIATLYALRMKPFSSVGMPALPSYNQLVQKTAEKDSDVLEQVKKSLALARRAATETRKTIDGLVGNMTIDPSSDLGKLKRSAVGIAVSATQMEANANKKLSEGSAESYVQPKLSVVRENYHVYFPVLTLEPPAKK